MIKLTPDTTIDAIYGHVRGLAQQPGQAAPRRAVVCILTRSGAAGREVYLAQRAPSLPFLGGSWAFPGGKLEPGETYLEAMVREAREELGIDLPHAADAYLDAGRWITPAFSPMRYDTRFLLYEVPAGSDAAQDAIAPDWRASDGELVDGAWMRPEQALAQWRAATLLLSDPVVRVVSALAARGDLRQVAGQCVRAAEQANTAPRVFDLVPGIAISPLRTFTLPPATHTNCYLIGTGEVIVVDPGAADAAEQEALAEAIESLAARGRRVVEIWLTHHHLDHVSGAADLAARLGVGIAAHAETAARLADVLEVQRHIEPDEVRVLAGDPPRRVRAIFTPGHAPGHLCFLEEETGFLLAGDMVAAVGTILIDPSEGDMARYIASLNLLRELAPAALLPAHGGTIVDVQHRLTTYVEHRLWREQRVLGAVSDAGPARSMELVERAYADVPPAVFPLAERSLLSHLQKLSSEGLVGEDAGLWRLL